MSLEFFNGLAADSFNARNSKWWENDITNSIDTELDITNSIDTELDSLTPSAGYTQIIDEHVCAVNDVFALNP